MLFFVLFFFPPYRRPSRPPGGSDCQRRYGTNLKVDETDPRSVIAEKEMKEGGKMS